jgi:large subunit ribosomal protein L10
MPAYRDRQPGFIKKAVTSGCLQMKEGGVKIMKLNQKISLVEDLKEKFLRSKVLIIADYKGLNVAAMSELRRKLKESNVECKVVKNTLLARASDQTGVEVIKSAFKGPTAIAISYNDPVAPAKILIDFAKDHKELEIKKGVISGKVLELSDIKALSDLPPREVLLGKLLAVMNAVPTSLVQVLSGIPRKMLYVLQAVKEQKEAA